MLLGPGSVSYCHTCSSSKASRLSITCVSFLCLQNGNEKNQTTTYPSGFKLKDDNNAPGMIVTSQPAFKISQPVRRRGDDKWPPKGAFEEPQMEVREFNIPKKGSKDYSKFFAQNALPHNHAAYRAPPGTQHFQVEEKDEVEVYKEEETRPPHRD
ncbi:hypothetical protein GWK47_032311 [Chionoecetes opilio]|uniref:Uncharacterized protein n=1 Tax=Chionoecetes opilio TaxID=41210 RepID=A0A8J5D1Q2_CHIOP|nr:hypothetical protein GWK47_032311 [Chionoecetes opilio]